MQEAIWTKLFLFLVIVLLAWIIACNVNSFKWLHGAREDNQVQS